jgi:hypothetical protein
MKTPIAITVIGLVVIGALLLWDSHAGNDGAAESVPAPPQKPPPRTCSVTSDDDLGNLKEPPAIEALVINPSEGTAVPGPRTAQITGTPSLAGDAAELIAARQQLEQLGAIKATTLQKSGFTARGFAELARFNELRRIEVNDVPLTDDLVAELIKARQITVLFLSNAHITTEQILKLSACSNIQELGLRLAVLDSRALSMIGNMPQLARLDLTASLIDNRDLKSLQSQHLASLNLTGTAVTSEGVANLEQLGGLCELTLSATAVGDAAIVHIARMHNLEVLHVPSTRISLASLPELKQLKQIRVLELPDRLGRIALGELKQALPKTLIYYTPRYLN